MASAKKISELTTAGALTGAELVPVVQNGGTLQTTTNALKIFSVGTLDNEVSVLSARMDGVSALATQTANAFASVEAGFIDLTLRVEAVSAAISVNNAAITSTNAAMSALDIRVDTVSALGTVNAAAITSVNAVLSTKVNRIGDYMDAVQYIEFDTSTVVATSAGRISWNLDESTLDIGMDAGVIAHSGLQLYQRVYNNTASTITKGTVIRVTGSQGQRLTAAPAQADGDANSATTFAVMAETVSVNNQGFAITEGVLKNVNTNGIADGTTLWLSPTSAGQYTPTKPVAPQHLVLLGFVVKGNSTGGGSIYVKIINGFELGELHDVKVSSSTSIANDEILAYNTSAGVWTNSTLLITTRAEVSVNTAAITSINGRLPAGTIANTSGTQTFSNKRVDPRAFVTTTGVSLTPDISQYDMYGFTALATAVSVNPPNGSPVNGNKLLFRFKDNGTSRAITWATAGAGSYRAVGVTLPAATAINKTTYVGCIYNSNDSYWDVVAATTEI